MSESPTTHFCHNCNTLVVIDDGSCVCPLCHQGFIELVGIPPDDESAGETNQFNEEDTPLYDGPSTSAGTGADVNAYSLNRLIRKRPVRRTANEPPVESAAASSNTNDPSVFTEFARNAAADETRQEMLNMWVRDAFLDTLGPPPLPRKQIRAIPTVHVNESQAKEICTVCLECFEEHEAVRKLPCEHIFHEHCILTWLRKHGTCPVCRSSAKYAPGGGDELSDASDTSSLAEEDNAHAGTADGQEEAEEGTLALVASRDQAGASRLTLVQMIEVNSGTADEREGDNNDSNNSLTEDETVAIVSSRDQAGVSRLTLVELIEVHSRTADEQEETSSSLTKQDMLAFVASRDQASDAGLTLVEFREVHSGTTDEQEEASNTDNIDGDSEENNLGVGASRDQAGAAGLTHNGIRETSSRSPAYVAHTHSVDDDFPLEEHINRVRAENNVRMLLVRRTAIDQSVNEEGEESDTDSSEENSLAELCSDRSRAVSNVEVRNNRVPENHQHSPASCGDNETGSAVQQSTSVELNSAAVASTEDDSNEQTVGHSQNDNETVLENENNEDTGEAEINDHENHDAQPE